MSCLRSVFGAALLVSSIAATETTIAAEWSVSTPLRLTLDHSDNRLLLPVADSSYGFALVFEPELRHAKEDSAWVVRPTLLLQRYADEATPDSNDHGLELSRQKRWGRSSASFVALTRLESTTSLTSSDSVITEPGNRRRSTSYAGSYAVDLTEQWATQVDAAWASVAYADTQQGRLPGYEYGTFRTQLSLKSDPRTNWFVAASAAELRTAVRLDPAEDRDYQLGVERQLSARTRLLVFAGMNETRSDARTLSELVGRLQLSQTNENGAWSLSLSRTTVPISQGGLIRRDLIGFDLERALTPRLRAEISFVHLRNRGSRDFLLGERRRLSNAQFAIQWSNTEQLSYELRAGRLASLDATGSLGTYASSISIGALWRPNRKVWSR